MKYRLLAFSIFLLLSINIFSQNNSSIVDTIYTHKYSIEGDTLPQSRIIRGFNLTMNVVYESSATWDLEKSDWHFVYKVLYDYTETGLYNLIENYQWSDELDMWTGTQKRTINYNDYNYQDSIVSFSWYEGAWVNENKYIFEIDSLERFLYQAAYLWDTIQNSWEIQYLYNREYDSLGNIIMQETYLRNNAGVLIGEGKFVHIYNDSGKRTLETTYSWNSELDDWEYKQKSEYEYNTEVDYSLLLRSNWNADTESWIPYSKIEQDLDANGKILLYERYAWNGDFWVGQSKDIRSFDTAGNNIVDENYKWDHNANDWIGNLKNISTYDDSGQLVLNIQQIWYLDAWINKYKSVWEYGIDGLRTLEEHWEWEGASNTWIGRWRTQRTYNDSALQTEIITQIWSSTDADWIFRDWLEIHYNDRGQREFSQFYLWLEESWQNRTRNEYEYDEDGRSISIAQYEYDSDLDAWVGYIKNEFTYDINGNLILSQNYGWDMEIMDWFIGSKTEQEFSADGIVVTLRATYLWNVETESWIGASKYTTDINANGFQLGQSYYTWDDEKEEFYLSFRSTTVLGMYYSEEIASLCDGESYTWKDSVITDAGIYMDKYVSLNKRDSVQVLILEEGISQFISVENSLCQGETIFWADQELFETGVYLDTLPAVNGCDSIIELDLTVLDLPSTGNITGEDGVTLQEVQVYTVSNDLELTYTWEVRGGTILGNPEANSVEVRWDTLGIGNVSVTALNASACLSEPESLDVTVGLTDAASHSLSAVMIYPNPVRDVLYIQSNQKQTTKEIFDLTGKKLRQSTENSINTSFLSPGSYYIVLKNKEGALLHKELFVKF